MGYANSDEALDREVDLTLAAMAFERREARRYCFDWATRLILAAHAGNTYEPPALKMLW